MADRAALEAAQGTVIEATLQLPDPGSPVLPALPNYLPRDLDWIESLPMTQQLAGVEGPGQLPDPPGGTRKAGVTEDASRNSPGNPQDAGPD